MSLIILLRIPKVINIQWVFSSPHLCTIVKICAEKKPLTLDLILIFQIEFHLSLSVPRHDICLFFDAFEEVETNFVWSCNVSRWRRETTKKVYTSVKRLAACDALQHFMLRYSCTLSVKLSYRSYMVNGFDWFQGLCAQTFYGHMHSCNHVVFNLKVS